MKAIYNKNGATVGWLEIETKIIYNVFGEALAFLNGDAAENAGKENVITYKGKHIGLLDKGFFRDYSGGVAAFIKDAEHLRAVGPVLPDTEDPTVPPTLSAVPTPPAPPVSLVPIPVVPGICLQNWSRLDWKAFVLES